METMTTALVAAQKEMQNPKFDSINPHFKNRYASLAAVRDAVIPVFNKYGIAVVQNLGASEHGVSCETILYGPGEPLRFGPMFVPAGKADAQGFGSAATYARRYTLLAIAGVVGEPDDDAEGAVKKEPEPVKTKSEALLESMLGPMDPVHAHDQELAARARQAILEAKAKGDKMKLDKIEVGLTDKVATGEMLKSTADELLKEIRA